MEAATTLHDAAREQHYASQLFNKKSSAKGRGVGFGVKG